MRRITFSLILAIFLVFFSSCASLFKTNVEDNTSQQELYGLQKELEVQQSEADRIYAEAIEVESMPEGEEKERRKKELELKLTESLGKTEDSISKLNSYMETPKRDRLVEEEIESLKAEYRIRRPLAHRVAKIDGLETKYSNALSGLREIIPLSGTIEEMELTDIETYFVSFSGSNYLYISCFSPVVFNTIMMDRNERVTKTMGLANKHWNEVFSDIIGIAEDFEGYIIEIGYLTKNFASDNTIEEVEILSIIVSSKDFLELHNYQIADRQLLSKSLVLIDGVRVGL